MWVHLVILSMVAISNLKGHYSTSSTNALLKRNYGDPCVDSTTCNSTQNLECREGFCRCFSGYSNDRYNICKKSYGESCSTVLDCNIDRFLTCNSTVIAASSNLYCQCQKPAEQIFNIVRESCVSLIGFNCAHTPGEFSLGCVDNAFCDMPIINGSMVHRCTCNEGYEPTENKLCRIIE